MTTSKKICLLIITLCLFPISVNAANKTLKETSVSASCKCTNNNGKLECENNNCSEKVLTNVMQQKCGDGGELSKISYKCTSDYGGSATGSSPRDACSKITTTENHLGVKATAVCTGGNATGNVHVGENFCADTASTMRFVGYVLLFLKVLIPFMLILMGTFDLYKAVTSDKSDTLGKQFTLFGKRLLSGVLIFFIPSIVLLVLNTIDGWDDVSNDYNKCATCLLEPNKCEAKDE